MTSEEYERRRKAIEEQCQADLDLIRAGCQAKLRALEIVWLHSSGDGAEAPRTVAAETVPDKAVPAETVPSEPQDSRRVRGVRWGDVLNDVRAVFPHLPEVFDKRDLCQAIGYEPSRSTLLNVLGILAQEKKVAIAYRSDGGRRTQYRKVQET